MPHPLLIVGLVIHLSTTSAYVWNTWKGKTRPNRMTFFMWALAPMIGVAAALARGAGWEVLPVFAAGFGPVLILIASFSNPNAYWRLTRFDYICGGLSLLALALWAITSEPLVALVFAIIGDAFAAWPTILKGYTHPETEHYGAYTGSTINLLLVFVVAPVYTLATVAFPLYLIAVNLTMLYLIFSHKLGFRRARAEVHANR